MFRWHALDGRPRAKSRTAPSLSDTTASGSPARQTAFARSDSHASGRSEIAASSEYTASVVASSSSERLYASTSVLAACCVPSGTFAGIRFTSPSSTSTRTGLAPASSSSSHRRTMPCVSASDHSARNVSPLAWSVSSNINASPTGVRSSRRVRPLTSGRGSSGRQTDPPSKRIIVTGPVTPAAACKRSSVSYGKRHRSGSTRPPVTPPELDTYSHRSDSPTTVIKNGGISSTCSIS
ncbi:MAG: hypothetical protein R3B49_08735 [Phycisphaerales bacterium]